MTEIMLIIAVTLAAGFVQGLTGFGSVLLSLPVLVVFLDVKTTVPLIGLFALSINAMLVWQLKRHLVLRRLAVLLLATVPGIPVGVYLLKTLPAQWLTLAIGILLLAFSIFSLRGFTPRRLGRGWATLAGFAAGCLGGSVGANGPPIIAYATMQPWPKDEIKGTMIGYFFTAGIAISGMHALSGLVTADVLRLYAAGLPGLAAGVLAGSVLYGRLAGKSYRALVLWTLAAMGVFMIYRSLPLQV